MDGVREVGVINQKLVWWNSEADAYERRNPSAPGLDPSIIEVIARYVSAGDTILEVGCGSAANLRALESRFLGQISCFGCDPSLSAIEHGRARDPKHQLARATADSLPYASASFDVVLISFVLHWVDPELLFQTVAEVDRVLRDCREGRPGILAIADFAPSVPQSRPYRHYEGLRTFKMDFSGLWTAHPGYRCVETKIFGDSADEDERRGLSILAKSLDAGYALRMD